MIFSFIFLNRNISVEGLGGSTAAKNSNTKTNLSLFSENSTGFCVLGGNMSFFSDVC